MPPADVSGPSRATLFGELATLGTALIEAETRLAEAESSIVAQTQTLARLRKENSFLTAALEDAGTKAGSAPLAVSPTARLRELESRIEQLGIAVSEKERARFALQEEVWALTEALAGYERLADIPAAGSDAEPEAGHSALITAEIVRLSQMVREQQLEMREYADRADRFALMLNAARSGQAGEPGTDPAVLAGLRADMTRVVAERDHARILAGKEADFVALSTPQRGYVFVLAFGLSGDIALQGLLNRIEGVDVRGENGGALAALAEAWTLASKSAPQDTASFAEVNRLGWHLANGFAGSVLAPPSDCRFSGFREIRWPDAPEQFDALLDYIAGFFPNARFVLHSRDPAEVAGLGWWAEQPAETVVEMLEQRCALFDAAAQARPDTAIRLRYEDYAADLSALAPVFDLVEAPFDAELVRKWWQEQGQ